MKCRFHLALILLLGCASGLSSSEVLDWKAALYQSGFRPDELEDHVTRELSVLGFVDRRFRPAIELARAEIERYYRETVMPQLEKAGAPDPPLAEVAAQIRELLTQ